MLRRVADSPDFHFRGTGRDAHHDFKVGGEKAAVTGINLAYETADHHLRGIEVCDNAIPEGTDRLDSRIRLFMHELGLLAQGYALVGVIVDGHDARLVQRNDVILENDGIGGSKVDSQLLI